MINLLVTSSIITTGALIFAIFIHFKYRDKTEHKNNKNI
jgi:heme/copper-type cytochrome/quinol oxidase subunit 2